MTLRILHVESASADRSVRAFAWVLMVAVGLWVVAIAVLLWGVTR